MSTEPRFEFFYDCSSPWTFFAFTRVIPLLERIGVAIEWRPILVGGVFNAVNKDLYAARESMFNNERRLKHYFKDLSDWAELCGVNVIQPDVFPVNSAKAMRGAIFAAEQGATVPWSDAVFRAYWCDNRDISQPEVLADLAPGAGLNAASLLEAVDAQVYKDALRANTDELIARGGYGSPTMFINGDDMHFGNDRLPLVEMRLQQLVSG